MRALLPCTIWRTCWAEELDKDQEQAEEVDEDQAMDTIQQKNITCKCAGACKRCPCKKGGEFCDTNCNCNTKLTCVNRGPGQEVSVERSIQRRRSEPQLSPEDVDRISELQRQQDTQIEEHIDSMDSSEMRNTLKKIYKKFPSLLLDNFSDAPAIDQPASSSPPEPQPEPALQPSWCVCGRCREMPSLLEMKCCGKAPDNCMSLSATVRFLVMNGGVLFLALLLRGAYIGYRAEDNQPEDAVHGNRSYRHAAYRHFILWQHGRLGAGNRRVIPSCCVWRVRDRYPEPNGQYTGYRPGRLN